MLVRGLAWLKFIDLIIRHNSNVSNGAQGGLLLRLHAKCIHTFSQIGAGDEEIWALSCCRISLLHVLVSGALQINLVGLLKTNIDSFDRLN